MYIADRRLWFTADRSRLVEEGDPEARFLFATPGSRIPVAEARALGLLADDDAPEAHPSADQRTGDAPDADARPAADAEAKALKVAPENKAVKPKDAKTV